MVLLLLRADVLCELYCQDSLACVSYTHRVVAKPLPMFLKLSTPGPLAAVQNLPLSFASLSRVIYVTCFMLPWHLRILHARHCYNTTW